MDGWMLVGIACLTSHTYKELITPIYTLFCQIKTIGKTSMGYETLLEQIKAVCAWNSLKEAKNSDQRIDKHCSSFLYTFCGPVNYGVIGV